MKIAVTLHFLDLAIEKKEKVSKTLPGVPNTKYFLH